jgi:hypothetical protein
MASLPIYLSKMVLFVSNFTLEDDTKLEATRNVKQLKNAENRSCEV